MAGSYKSELRKTDVESAVGDAYDELSNLRDEMREWADNMEGGGLGHTDKYSQVSETADGLDNVADDQPDVPSFLGELSVEFYESINRRKGRGPSRAVRRDNAVSALTAVSELVTSLIDNDGKNDDGEVVDDWDADVAQEFVDKLESDFSEVDGLEFPSMY